MAATALLLGTAAMVGGPEGAPLLRENLNAIAIAGAGGVGVALQLIHIYMSNLKRLLQASERVQATKRLPTWRHLHAV